MVTTTDREFGNVPGSTEAVWEVITESEVAEEQLAARTPPETIYIPEPVLDVAVRCAVKDRMQAAHRPPIEYGFWLGAAEDGGLAFSARPMPRPAPQNARRCTSEQTQPVERSIAERWLSLARFAIDSVDRVRRAFMPSDRTLMHVRVHAPLAYDSAVKRKISMYHRRRALPLEVALPTVDDALRAVDFRQTPQLVFGQGIGVFIIPSGQVPWMNAWQRSAFKAKQSELIAEQEMLRQDYASALIGEPISGRLAAALREMPIAKDAQVKSATELFDATIKALDGTDYGAAMNNPVVYHGVYVYLKRMLQELGCEGYVNTYATDGPRFTRFTG